MYRYVTIPNLKRDRPLSSRFPSPTIGSTIMVARKKPKSTRRKHQHNGHHSHHTRRPRSRRGTSESFSGDPAAEGSRSARASGESSAAVATSVSASASAVDAHQASSPGDGEGTVAVGLSPPSKLLAPSSSLLSPAIPSTPVMRRIDDGREAMAALGSDAVTLSDAAVAATAGDGHGKKSEGAAHEGIVEVDAEGSDRRENGPAAYSTVTAAAAASEAASASRRGEREVSPVTHSVEADGEQGVRSGYAQEVQDYGQTTHFDDDGGVGGSSARNDLLGSQAPLHISGASPPGAMGSINSAATETPSQVLDCRPDGNGAAIVGPDGVTMDVESCPPEGSVGEPPKPETSGSTIISVGALAPSRRDAVAAAVTDLGVPPGSSDALALAHIFLSNRRDSATALSGGRGSCFGTDVGGTHEDDGPTPLLTQQSPLRDAAAAAAASAAGRDARSVGTGGVAAEEITASCANGTCVCYPGGKEESSGMKQQVVAVEAISPRAAAWLSGGSAEETSAAAGTIPDAPSADSDSAGRSDSDGDDDLERERNGEDAVRSSTLLEESRVAAPGSANHDHPGEGRSIFSGVGSGCAQLKEKMKADEEETVVADNGRGGVSRGDRYSCSAVTPTAGALVAGGEGALPAGSARAAVATARLPPILTPGLGFSPKASADAVVRAFGETASTQVL